MSPTPNMPRIFLSYARADGESFARSLRKRLQKHGLSLWQDRTDMEGGKGWWQQILEALDHVEYLVLVMTPAAIASPIVAKEWRMARQKGVRVVPVIGAKGLKFEKLPRWMEQVHFVNTKDHREWARFLRMLESPASKIRTPFMVEELPKDFVPRKHECEALIERLLDTQEGQSVAITAALRGAGGYGKTTLAKAICHDERVQETFHDGVLWVTLGKQPGNLISYVEDLVVVLTGQRPGFSGIEAATASLVELLRDRSMLIVIDDVWNSAHLKPFLQGGLRCTRLITTRNSETLPAEASKLSVDAMQSEEAVALLKYRLPAGEEKAFQKLASRLGEWPVLLKLVNGLLCDRVVEKGEQLTSALIYVGRALDKKGLTAFDAKDPQERVQAVTKTVEVSLQLLDEHERQRYTELAIFPEDVEVPLETIQKLWKVTAKLEEDDTQELCRHLHNLSLLLNVNLATRRIRLHDVLRSYLLQTQTNTRIAEIHCAFLDGYGLTTWSELNPKEPYLWKWLSYHLEEAGRQVELTALLWRFEWLQSKLEATDVIRLLEDFERASGEGTLKLLMQAIQLSSDAVQTDPKQLAGQLVGRLSHLSEPDVTSFVSDTVDHQRGKAWFCPMLPSLVVPGGALLRTLRGHLDIVTAVTLTPNGSNLISASNDQTLKVWDLLSGREVHTLRGHNDLVWAVAVTPDGCQVISGSYDQMVRVWDLATGQEVRALSGHKDAVWSVVLTPDGRQVISGSEDQMLKVWDLTTGQEICTLLGHEGAVMAVAVTPDSRLMASGSEDKTLKVWDLATHEEVKTLHGHNDAVVAVAVTPDGRQVVSGSYDHLLKVWDLATGQEVYTLRGHEDAVWSVAVTSDGRHAISGSEDQTLKVWDLATGQEIRTLREHGKSVRAVTSNGRRVVSGSEDRTIKLWDLEVEQEINSLGRHGGVIWAAVTTPDGQHVVSASEDRTLKVWDLITGREVQALRGHEDAVVAVAITPDGQRVVSGSDDYTLKVWDLESEQEPSTLSGHNGVVTSVVVTPDGKHVVSGSDDYSIKVWDLKTGEEVYTLRGHRDVITTIVITPDGRRIVSGSDDHTIKMWDLSTGDNVNTLCGHGSAVTALALMPNGGQLLSGAEDQILRWWDLETGKENEALHALQGHEDAITAMIVMPCGQKIISLSNDKLVLRMLKNGDQISSFIGDGELTCVTLSGTKPMCVVGDAKGKLHFLRLEGF